MSKPTQKSPDRYLKTDHLKADLKSRSIKGGAITIIGQALRFTLRMGSTIILARLLTPFDYGLIGMVAVVVNFVALFKDLGLSVATIQRAELNHQQVSTMFWINVGVGLTIVVLTIALSPAIAWFYQEPRLIPITIVLASGMLLGGLSVQHEALLKRQMRFGQLALIEISSMFVGSVAAIISAWYGAGYWALVILQLSGQLTILVGVWLMCGWRPGFPKWDSSIRPMLAIGGNYTGFTILHYFSTNFDNILIGSSLGPRPLGLYDKAYQLLLLPLRQINIPIRNVAIPTLSSLHTEPVRYKVYYHKALLLMTTFGMPLVVFTFVVADQLVPLLLGEQWADVVPIFRVLGLAAFLSTFNMAAGWVFISFGRTDRQFRWGIIASIITTLSFVIGIRWGAIGVAAGFSISRLIIQPLELIYCYRGLPLQIEDLLRTLSLPSFASIGAGLLLWNLNVLVNISNSEAIALFLNTIFYALLYLGLWVIFPQGRRTLKDLLKLVKELKRKPKGAGNIKKKN